MKIYTLLFYLITFSSFSQSKDKRELLIGTFKQNSIMTCQNTLILKKDGKFERTITVLKGSESIFNYHVGDWIFKNDTLTITDKETKKLNQFHFFSGSKGHYLMQLNPADCIYKKE